ncbi:uncharacterized protein BKA78DRAFT_299712 [Phyllosticta capitalensis]|uniref:uncharacterized protein n=1 Tax=Phyllosticta capitalensis TaxID=121624 RepID=UPI003130663C
MAEPDELDEDLFADLYDNEDVQAKSTQPAAPAAQSEPVQEPSQPAQPPTPAVNQEQQAADHDVSGSFAGAGDVGDSKMENDESEAFHYNNGQSSGNGFPRPIGIKEDG